MPMHAVVIITNYQLYLYSKRQFLNSFYWQIQSCVLTGNPYLHHMFTRYMCCYFNDVEQGLDEERPDLQYSLISNTYHYSCQSHIPRTYPYCKSPTLTMVTHPHIPRKYPYCKPPNLTIITHSHIPRTYPHCKSPTLSKVIHPHIPRICPHLHKSPTLTSHTPTHM